MELQSLNKAPGIKGFEIHVWQGDLDKGGMELDQDRYLLDARETEKAGCFKFARDAKRYIAGRAFVRRVVSGYLKMNPKDLEFAYTRFGKPLVKFQPLGRDLRFNFSHSEGACLLAITEGREIGCDLEKVREDRFLLEMAFQFFHKNERAWLRQLPLEQSGTQSYVLWALKEAYLKALGDGLLRSLDQFCLIPRTRGDAQLDALGDWRKWVLRHFTVNDEYAAAFCVEGEDSEGWKVLKVENQEKEDISW